MYQVMYTIVSLWPICAAAYWSMFTVGPSL